MIKRTLQLFLVVMTIGVTLLPPVVIAQTLSYSQISAYLWTDKSVYAPGEPITLRWTARANSDPAHYSVVIYRQNNQTGEKTYMSIGGSPSASPVDIVGRTADQGLAAFTAGDTTK